MQMPDGWKIKCIEEIAKVTSGGTPNRDVPVFWGGAIPWIRTTEVQNCKIRETDVKEFITEEGLRNSSAKYVPKNTILMAMIGQGKTRGQVAILTFKATTNQNCAAIIYDDDQCPEYHFNYFLSQYENIRNTSNSAGQSNLSGGLIKQIRVPVPPLSEQQKIAEILSTWDKAIEKREALIAAKQKRKKALMQQLLTGNKRFAGFEGEWKTFHLAELFKERNETGYVDLSLLSITREKGVIPRNEVERKDTSNDDKSKYLRIRPGDIGYNTMRMWQGVSALSTLEGIISPAYTVCIPTDKIDGKFASYLFKSTPIIHLFQRYSQGLTSDTWNLKFHHFGEIKVSIPVEVKEQQKIASILTAADIEIETHQKQLAALKEQKKGLMQQLLTGKKRVQIKMEVKCLSLKCFNSF